MLEMNLGSVCTLCVSRQDPLDEKQAISFCVCRQESVGSVIQQTTSQFVEASSRHASSSNAKRLVLLTCLELSTQNCITHKIV